MTVDYWVANSGSLMHQIFMIVMGALYASAYVLGISYKAMNIYAYFILYPLSFTAFFVKGWKRFMFIPISLLFLLIPNFEELSVVFFDRCVTFLNDSAATFDSDYIRMSIYLCVVVPVVLYLPFVAFKYKAKGLLYTFTGLGAMSYLYLALIYPKFEPLVNTYF